MLHPTRDRLLNPRTRHHVGTGQSLGTALTVIHATTLTKVTRGNVGNRQIRQAATILEVVVVVEIMGTREAGEVDMAVAVMAVVDMEVVVGVVDMEVVVMVAADVAEDM